MIFLCDNFVKISMTKQQLRALTIHAGVMGLRPPVRGLEDV